jgi:hypothetical protein
VLGILVHLLRTIGSDFHALAVTLGLGSFGLAVGFAEFSVGQRLRHRAVEPELVGAGAPWRTVTVAAEPSREYELLGTSASPRANPYARLSLRPPQELVLARGDRG